MLDFPSSVLMDIAPPRGNPFRRLVRFMADIGQLRSPSLVVPPSGPQVYVAVTLRRDEALHQDRHRGVGDV
jgi:hypothetical protein